MRLLFKYANNEKMVEAATCEVFYGQVIHARAAAFSVR